MRAGDAIFTGLTSSAACFRLEDLFAVRPRIGVGPSSAFLAAFLAATGCGGSTGGMGAPDGGVEGSVSSVDGSASTDDGSDSSVDGFASTDDGSDSSDGNGPSTSCAQL